MSSLQIEEALHRHGVWLILACTSTVPQEPAAREVSCHGAERLRHSLFSDLAGLPAITLAGLAWPPDRRRGGMAEVSTAYLPPALQEHEVG